MELQELKIEMDPEDLVDFRYFLLEKGSDNLDLTPIHKVTAGFQREPILIALVVALGGPVIIREFVGLAKEWLRLRARERTINMVLTMQQQGRKDHRVSPDVLV
jgi:hypothetical protein